MNRLTKQNNNFNLIRLLACIQVLVLHSLDAYDIGYDTTFYKTWWLFPGVIIFYSISGFLIAKSYENNNPSLFISNRISRIYPGLITCVLISLIPLYLFGLIHPNLDLLKYIIAQASVFQFFVPESIKHFGLGHPNGALWTISVEIQFYFCFFALGHLYKWKSKTKRHKNILIISLIIISCITNYLSNHLLYTEGILYKLTFNSIIYNFTFFGIGILLWNNFELIKKFIINKSTTWLFVLIFLVIIIVSNNIHITRYQFDFISYLYLTVLILTIFSFAFSNLRFRFTFIKNNDISYGTYLYHCLIINLFLQLSIPGDFIPLIYILSIILGFLSWKIIESPFLQKRK